MYRYPESRWVRFALKAHIKNSSKQLQRNNWQQSVREDLKKLGLLTLKDLQDSNGKMRKSLVELKLNFKQGIKEETAQIEDIV